MIVLSISEGRAAPGELFRALVKQAGAGWYAVALLGPLALALVAWALEPLFGGPPLTPAIIPWAALFPLLLTMLLSNVWEELGWRGFALPRLLQTRPALHASILMGVLWSVWHLPLILNPQAAMSRLPLWAEPLFSIALSVIYTWLYLQTRGSLLYVTLFHAASNAVSFALLEVHPDFVHHYGVMVGVTALAAVALSIVYGPTLTRSRTETS